MYSHMYSITYDDQDTATPAQPIPVPINLPYHDDQAKEEMTHFSQFGSRNKYYNSGNMPFEEMGLVTYWEGTMRDIAHKFLFGPSLAQKRNQIVINLVGLQTPVVDEIDFVNNQRLHGDYFGEMFDTRHPCETIEAHAMLQALQHPIKLVVVNDSHKYSFDNTVNSQQAFLVHCKENGFTTVTVPAYHVLFFNAKLIHAG